MRVRILGSAAGGGFPQWNCACRNCCALRAGNFRGKARTQTQVAVSADGCSWFLLGASPDLRQQIEVTPALHPRDGVRQSPISGVLLGSADLDHVLGLLLLREFQPLHIYGTSSVLQILRGDNSMFGMLNRIPRQAVWTEIDPADRFPLTATDGSHSGLECRAITLGTRYPAYVADSNALKPDHALLGFMVGDRPGVRLAYLPAVPEIDDRLMQALDGASVLLFDGTFWSDDELIQVQGSGQTAREMGHVPVGGPEGSLERLRKVRGPRKIFVHVNNTNPMLDESGPEIRIVREAGWEVAEDGWQFEL
jgi:pyrroloquinoline quinone biosynthesis protein B